jgi:hypothetical protein
MRFECTNCETVHGIAEDEARVLAREFIAAVDDGGVRFGESPLPVLPLATSELFAPGGGKMFACLVAEDGEGERRVLFAFSGMLARKWSWPGWAPPCFDARRWRELEATYDPEIAALSAKLEAGGDTRGLQEERAQRSRELMARYHGLYRIAGPGGRVHALEAIVGAGKMVSGMGDCCAPKLLNAAYRRGWHPRSMVEFFVGSSRRPGVRVHGREYAPCDDKCGPLMAYLNCPTWSSETQ